MLLKSLFLFLIIFLYFVSTLLAQENQSQNEMVPGYFEKDSWEPDDLEKNESLNREPKGLIFPLKSFSLSLIQIYQKRISTNSTIHRCPYKTTCSNFAYQSISDNVFWVGMLLFIDRYYFRENPGAPYNYPLYENAEGILRLNDDYYLTSEKY